MLARFNDIWHHFFHNVLNLRFGGDCTKHVILRVHNLSFPYSTKYVIIHCGPNKTKLCADYCYCSFLNFISSCNKFKPALFDLRKIERRFPPLSKNNIYNNKTKKNARLFKKHQFCKPKHIHKSFTQCLHVCEVSLPAPVTTICVVSSSLFIPANISNIDPPTCISINCVEIPLNVIKYNAD